MILIGGACLGGWALLALLGAERQRLLNEVEAPKPRHPQPLGPPTSKPPHTRPEPKRRTQDEPSGPKNRGRSSKPPGAAAPANAR